MCSDSSIIIVISFTQLQNHFEINELKLVLLIKMLSIHFHKSKLNETELNVGKKDLRMQLVTILINSDHNHTVIL